MVVSNNNIKTNERAFHKKQIFTKVLNTPDGLCFLKYLIEDVLYKSAYNKDDVYKTHMKLAEQDLVKYFLKFVIDESALSRVSTIKVKLQKGDNNGPSTNR